MVEKARTSRDDALLADAQGVAEILSCSVRHVRRLSGAGLLPRPVRLGALVRWRRSDIEQWVQNGCTTVTRRQS